MTAGNSSQITDGAAAVLIMSEEKANELGLRPRARFHTFALAGVDPVTMLTGPIPATDKALERAGLSIDDIDLFEVNEAFASVIGAWSPTPVPTWEKTNVNGGAMALGHPLGASGAKLLTTLVNELERTGGRYGLQTMCEGGGMANATIIERIPLPRVHRLRRGRHRCRDRRRSGPSGCWRPRIRPSPIPRTSSRWRCITVAPCVACGSL